MKAFKFSLQTVMDWHGKKAEAAKMELERLHEQQQQVRLRREALQLEIKGLHENRGVPQAIPAHELLQLAQYEASLQSLGAQIQAQETSWEQRVEAQRLKCIESDREFRLLERFKERRLEEWQHELEQETESTAANSFLAKWARESRA